MVLLWGCNMKACCFTCCKVDAPQGMRLVCLKGGEDNEKEVRHNDVCLDYEESEMVELVEIDESGLLVVL